MENDDHVAAVAARLPPVRYYVPYEEEDPVVEQEAPDSPQSPYEISDHFPPLVFLNRGYQPSVHHDDDKDVAMADEPIMLPEEPPPAAAAWTRPWPREDDDLYYYVQDEDDPVSVRKGLEVQSRRYAVHALRHYNADDSFNGGGGVKYELVEATGSQGIVLDSGDIIGHVTFTARAIIIDPAAPPPRQADHLPRPFFAEVREPGTVPTCIVSMDDGDDQGRDDLCQFCGDALKHPKVHRSRATHSVVDPIRDRSIMDGVSATDAKMDCDP